MKKSLKRPGIEKEITLSDGTKVILNIAPMTAGKYLEIQKQYPYMANAEHQDAIMGGITLISQAIKSWEYEEEPTPENILELPMEDISTLTKEVMPQKKNDA